MRKYIRVLFTLIFFLSFFTISGCGKSSEEKNQEWKKEIVERENRERQEKKETISKIESRFKARYFPPQLGKKFYTYQIQQYIESNSGKNIVFAGYLQDITLLKDRYILHFVTKIGDNFPQTIIRFRISSDKINIENLSISEGKKSVTYSSFYDDPEYYIVARIDEVKNIITYEYDGNFLSEEEVEIETDLNFNLIANGQLIKLSKFKNNLQ